MNYQFHEVANIFPMMDEQSFSELCKDIQNNGLIESIWTHEGQIIDGRNRYRACLQVGIEPTFREWDGKGSLVEFVISLNLNRRHLTSSQKAAIALGVLPMLEREAKERQRAAGRFDGRNPDGSPKLQVTTELKEPEKNHNEAARQAAAIVGTSATRVYEMKQIARKMPEKVEAIKRGEVSVDKVLSEIRKKSPQAPKKKLSEEEIHKPKRECTEAMQFAVIAMSQLDRIREDDPQKVAAFRRVMDYINSRMKGE